MSIPVPPHYRAFRVLLVLVVLLALAGAAWAVVDPAVLGSVLRALGVG